MPWTVSIAHTRQRYLSTCLSLYLYLFHSLSLSFSLSISQLSPPPLSSSLHCFILSHALSSFNLFFLSHLFTSISMTPSRTPPPQSKSLCPCVNSTTYQPTQPPQPLQFTAKPAPHKRNTSVCLCQSKPKAGTLTRDIGSVAFSITHCYDISIKRHCVYVSEPRSYYC